MVSNWVTQVMRPKVKTVNLKRGNTSDEESDFFFDRAIAFVPAYLKVLFFHGSLSLK
ncbi:hypothetical protein COO91_10028 (plasmid) [Nostoc flagelliforme CCNUN1]|uniref:Uncharacterized protein n=1 Tax=Nostoc flagelliforme CCNUN1 TaxID=2038116 RepID=A0A2K8T8C8_9NOSO|nr:hypothetical protein [Nostoc flagelliforme]AUB43833.1 hypothetical protein COO91_10028 [Nostoc flagelliforme CCNUN1]